MNRPARDETVGVSSPPAKRTPVAVTANAEMGSAASRNRPGRRHNVRLSAPGGASVIVAAGISETAAGRLAEALNDFLTAALGGPSTVPSCQYCAAPLHPSAQGRPPTYCGPACRQRAYRHRHRS